MSKHKKIHKWKQHNLRLHNKAVNTTITTNNNDRFMKNNTLIYILSKATQPQKVVT